MRAVDTNVVVRFLMADDHRQFARARAAILAGDIFVSLTVLLESEWVLRRAYGLSRDRIVAVLGEFAGLPSVTVEASPLVMAALDWTEAGLDFADALHLAKAGGCTAFLSFDRQLARRAAGRSPVPVEAP